ncbi:cyclic diguanylate phosphodiesterase [Actinoplanes sp. SE50]|uniref:helix-turn-helix domain-containing protein n=1 Tax=unclassified Actinoplanes TaxID=2626549 RepID=UPI00023ED278|nr:MULTISPECIES: helix-turn-helix domain-containing protein [unclassified Actinoplanes]AEV85576.1 Purine catabolism regulatory protein [Actinoplanes sp. SE50/110]ATO83969.1 cyclic diguanylate phosphodiesterase [Actinoplanes sp. SE50]SLM01379.1 diguanylate phosphodiesterase [Actinoplanes sp. SE50/110]
MSRGLAYLDLLAREAALVEFERPLIAARAAGAPAAELDDLEQAKLLALRVRALLERRRRREEELSALYDTAGDLAGLRDVDAVLRAIVHRARTLLNVDVSYMTLNDQERGDTYMRITDGSVAASFQNLRLPPGAGLGGLVALTGTPYATANYPTDARFAHTTDIDMGVGDEGLVAILGVPMRLGSTVIGVLFAANRAERPFAREEVALLLSLAAHASVALDTARLLSETQTALAELSAANATIQAHSASVERAAAAHDRMTALVLRGGGVDDVAADLVDVLSGALLVIDAHGRTLATARTRGVAATLPEPDGSTVDEAVAASRGEGRSVRRHDLVIAAVVAGADNLGALVFRPDPGPLAAADQRILERAAQVTALLLLFRRTVAEAEAQVRGDLLDDLISRPVRDPDAVRDRAGRLGLDVDAPYVVVVAGEDTGDGLRQRAVSWARTFAAGRRGLAMSRDARVTLMLPGEDPAGTARQVARELSRALGRPVTAGGAGPVRGATAVAPAYREADQCLSALITLGRSGTGAGTEELGYVGLLLGERRDVTGFVHTVLGPVVEYDERRGTALTTTLEVYFDCGGGLARAADALHVHVNTVTQRLDRVAQLLGDDWQHPRRVLDLQLALRLHRLRAPLAVDHT